MVEKLTDDFIKDKRAELLALPKTERKPIEIRDTVQRGLTLRLQPSGVATFFLQFRDNVGRQGRIKIGRYGKNVHDREIGIPDARKTAKDYNAKVTLGDNPADDRREARQGLTLKEFINGPYKEWAEAADSEGRMNLKSSASTLSRLEYGFRSLLNHKLDSLTLADFERNRLSRLRMKPKSKGDHKTPKGTTLNRDAAHMRAALARAVKWGYMDSNPLIGITKIRENRNKGIRSLSEDEEKSILAVFEKRRAALMDAGGPVPRFLTFLEPAFILSIETGLRRTEALSLLWSDIDMDRLTVTVRAEVAKSDKDRIILLSDRAAEALREWRAQTSGEEVFPNATIDALRGQWTRVLRDAKVKARWHDLRHSYGKRKALAGMPINVLRQQMGHQSIVTTNLYIEAEAEDARQWINPKPTTQKEE